MHAHHVHWAAPPLVSLCLAAQSIFIPWTILIHHLKLAQSSTAGILLNKVLMGLENRNCGVLICMGGEYVTKML